MRPAVLYTFVGTRDPESLPGPAVDPGPVLSLLRERSFQHVVLLITGAAYAERAHTIKEVALREELCRRFTFAEITLESVVDYEEIFLALNESIGSVERSLQQQRYDRYVLLDPGTPQMQTVWFLLVQSGRFPARLLQGTPARFAGGTYHSREIRLDPDRFPIRIALAETAGTVMLFQSAYSSPDRLRRRDARADSAPPPSTVEEPRRAARLDWQVVSPEIVGGSKAIVDLMQRVHRYAAYDAPALVLGETGTGKELVARHIHKASRRSASAFVTANSAGLTGETLDSTLFGHRKGAFTGATNERPGLFRAADGGTVFLDEVGDLPADTQARLLRVLDYGEVTPLGADTPLQVDVRIVAATNRDLEAMVDDGSFRADLYERLSGVVLTLPPLRDRSEDIVPLADHFVSKFNDRYGTERTLSPEVHTHLRAYDWPRNIRQLRNAVERACMLAEEREVSRLVVAEALGIEAGDGSSDAAAESVGTTETTASAAIDDRTPPGTSSVDASAAIDDRPAAAALTPATWDGREPVDLPAVLTGIEREWYARAVELADGNMARAARLLGVKPPAFRKALRERFDDL